MRHNQIAVGVLDDFLSDACQRAPFAVVDGFGRAPFMDFEFTDLARKSVRSDACESLTTHLEEGGEGEEIKHRSIDQF